MNFNWLFVLHCIYLWLKIHLDSTLSLGLKPWCQVEIIFISLKREKLSCLHAVDLGLEILQEHIVCDSHSHADPHKFEQVMTSEDLVWHTSGRDSLQLDSLPPCGAPGQRAPAIGGCSWPSVTVLLTLWGCCSITQQLSSAQLPPSPKWSPADPRWG